MNHDHSNWWGAGAAGAFWLIGHATLSNLALTVSIVAGVLTCIKTVRDIRRQERTKADE